MELKNGKVFTQKILNFNHYCYCDDDYNSLINEIHNFLLKKENVTLIVSTFFYKLPYFVELLSEKLENTRVIPLIMFFIESNYIITEKEEFVINEVHSHFVTKTTCKVSNKTLIIVSQKLEQFDFDNELLGKIQWKNNDLSVEDKYNCINIDKVDFLNNSSKRANTEEDFADLNCGDSKIDVNFTLLQFYQNIAETLKQSITNRNKQLIFGILLYLNDVEKYIDNWEENWFNLSQKQAYCKGELTIKESDFEVKTIPDKRCFTNNDKFWLLAESVDFTCLFSRRNNDGTIQTGKFSIPNKHLSNIAFIVNNKSIIKLFLEAKKDILNNLNIISKIDNKLFYSKIDFYNE